jgi:TolB-like protein/Tfp pilus assembly protein PilF
MDDDEEATVRTLKTYRAAINDLVQQYRGRIVDSPGDNILAEFSSVVDAVNCAVEIQRDLAERNTELAYNRQMQFRIGVNLGDVIEDGGNIYGDGVNIAARVESLAEAGGICISGRAYDQVSNKLGLEYENLGEHQVKNISTPIRVYRVLSYPGAAAHRVVQAKEAVSKKWRNLSIAAGAVVVVVAIVVGIWQFYTRRPQIEPASEEKMTFPLPDKPSLVVLPFDNLSKDAGQDKLVDGITDQLIMGLSKIPYMFVIAKETSFSYKGKAVEVRRVSEELGVQYVLEGSVQRSGDRIRITAQLIDAIAGHHLWSERYDRELKDIFELQDDITVNIMQAMQLKVTGLAILENKPPPPSIEAHLKILKAIEHIYRWTKEDNALARKLYEEAIELNPEYASTYRLLGWTYHHDVLYGWSESPDESLEKAEELANKALSLGDEGAYILLSVIYLKKGQYDKAVAIGEKGLVLNSNWANYNAIFADVLRAVDRYDEALALMKKAIRLNPNYPPWYLINWGLIYRSMGRYNDAVPLYEKYIELSPSDFWGYLDLITCYMHLNRKKEARETVAEVLKINPKLTIEFVSKIEEFEPYLEALRKAGLPE